MTNEAFQGEWTAWLPSSLLLSLRSLNGQEQPLGGLKLFFRKLLSGKRK